MSRPKSTYGRDLPATPAKPRRKKIRLQAGQILYTIDEAAEALRVSRSTLHKMRTEGLITPSHVLGTDSKVAYTVFELERFARSLPPAPMVAEPPQLSAVS